MGMTGRRALWTAHMKGNRKFRRYLHNSAPNVLSLCFLRSYYSRSGSPFQAVRGENPVPSGRPAPFRISASVSALRLTHDFDPEERKSRKPVRVFRLFGIMPAAGIEPARPFGQQILSLPRLPVPTRRRSAAPRRSIPQIHVHQRNSGPQAQSSIAQKA